MNPNKIVVYVQGGVVQSVYSSDPLIQIKVVDGDDLGEEGRDVDEELEKEIIDLEMIF